MLDKKRGKLLNAKIINEIGSNGKKRILRNELPLDTPYEVQIFPIDYCNFKCQYCIRSSSFDKEFSYGFAESKLSFNVYKKCVNDMIAFSDKLKILRFAGTGEPFFHKDIFDMVEYAYEKKIADHIEIITNGSLLNDVIIKKLLQIDGKLSRLVISVQGITSETYQSICNYNINLKEFIHKLKTYYNIKKKTEIYIKIVSCALKDKNEENIFYTMFGDVCDKIQIEHVIPMTSKIDYSNLCTSKNGQFYGKQGVIVDNYEICPFPFYKMFIAPDGSVYGCCAQELPHSIGNIRERGVLDIWKSKEAVQFQKSMLNGTINCNDSVCQGCDAYRYLCMPEDKITSSDAKFLSDQYIVKEI